MSTEDTAEYAGRFPALHEKGYRHFFFAQIVSLSGTWMQSAAQGWLVLSLTDSAFWLGAVSAAMATPILLLSLMGGVLADRFPKRSLLLFTQASSMIPALTLSVLIATGHVTVVWVLFMATLLGTVNSLDIPVRQSFLVELTGRKALGNAIALNSTIFNGARLIGPALAGFIIAQFGLAVCFFVNALSFLPVVWVLVKMRPTGRAAAISREPVGSAIAGAIRYVRDDVVVRLMMVQIGVTSLFGIPYHSIIPAMARDVLGLGAGGYSVLLSAGGGGALIGAAVLAFRGGGADPRRYILWSGVLFAGGVLAFGLSPGLPWAIVALVVTGWGMVNLLATVNQRIQATVPDELRGRVMSLYILLFLGMIPFGSLLFGTVAQLTNVRVPMVLGGIICLVTTVWIGRAESSGAG